MNAQQYFQKYDVGLKFGINTAFSDLAQNKNLYSSALNFNYYLTPYTAISVETQLGKLRGGGLNIDPNQRQYTNNYWAVYLQGKYYLGNLLDKTERDFLALFNNLYVSGGLGIVKNSISKNTRIKPDGTGYVFPGLDKSLDLLVPIDMGYDFPIYNQFREYKWEVSISGQFVQTLGEGLDGYDIAPNSTNKGYPDSFATFMIGVKYSFGKINYWSNNASKKL